MTNWENLSELEQLQIIYSDAHKDAYGFRPRDGGIHAPVTVADYRDAIESCSQRAADEEAEEAAFAAKRLATVEAEIAALMTDHSLDRATAIRWWYEAEGYEAPTGEFAHFDIQEAEHILWKRGILFSGRYLVDEFKAHP